MSTLYLVTGAAGHLGNTVVSKLLEQGKSVRGLVLPNEENIPGCEVFYGDVCKPETLSEFFSAPVGAELIVIHCAGIVSISSGFKQIVYDVNVTGTKNIVDMCEKQNVKRLIYVSSVHAIPELPDEQLISEISEFDPDKVVGLYAKTKAEATKYVLDACKRGLNACVVHPSGMSGPNDHGRGHLTTLIIDYCKKRLTSSLDGGYDFVDVRDVADGILSCCERGKPGDCYILSNRYFKVGEILFMLHTITKTREIKRVLPKWFLNVTAPLAEAYYKLLRQPPLFTAYSISTLNSNANFSHDKATQELKYKPRSMKETLADTVKWLREQGRL